VTFAIIHLDNLEPLVVTRSLTHGISPIGLGKVFRRSIVIRQKGVFEENSLDTGDFDFDKRREI
jgi:hypothetical protein